MKNQQNFPNIMPVLFIGHGSPMNAIEKNDFTDNLKKWGKSLPVPKAVLMVSAHWLTRGTLVHSAHHPKMIYDMGGFPDALYRVQYPAPGSPEFAAEVVTSVKKTRVNKDFDWGFDHGMWSVMLHLFPEANIPVFQLSIDYHQDARYHLELASELKQLREKGVLIIGSGNITHNLRQFDLSDIDAKPADWALEFDSKIIQHINEGNNLAVADYKKLGALANLAHPEPSHFLPLMYTLGLREQSDSVIYPYDKFQYGTFSMRCIQIG